MKLFYSPTSPYVRKVMVLIAEAGLTGIETVAVSGTPIAPDAGLITRNPLGKIPALERPDGPILYDSRVICRYLDAVAGAGMYPEPPDLWECLTLEATADGILDAALLMVYESRLRPEDKRHEPWVEGQWAKVARSLDRLDATLPAPSAPAQSAPAQSAPDRIDMGQIALGCALGYLEFRHAGRRWRDGRPALAAWEARFAARPSMMATLPQA